MKKCLTVVIPTYNVEKYLDRCLISLTTDKSILDDIEIIIVNDGSKDNSLEIARRYEKEFPKTIKVIDKENGGHGSTINRGYKEATGKYFRVLDSDDWVNVDDFTEYVNKLKTLDVDLVLTDYTKELVYQNEENRFGYKLEKNKILNFEDIDLDALRPDYFCLTSMTIKTEILRKINLHLDEKTFYVDMEYILFPINEINTLIYLDLNLYRYFFGRADQSVNISSFVRNRKNHETVLRRLIDFYEDNEFTEKKREYVKYIICLTLNTEYIIFTNMKLPDKKTKNEIKEFDKYLKAKSPSLYKEIGKYSKSVRWNRKTKFVFAQSKKFWFSRLANFLEMRHKNRQANKARKK